MRAMTIDFRSREPSYTQLARILREKISSGTWQHDDQLPSVRELASEYHLAVETVTKAIGVLADEGLVVAVPGRGTFVL